jgi:hypothetical protein
VQKQLVREGEGGREGGREEWERERESYIVPLHCMIAYKRVLCYD